MKSGIAGCFFPLRSLLIIAEVWNVFSKNSIILPKDSGRKRKTSHKTKKIIRHLRIAHGFILQSAFLTSVDS